ncbi:MAG TPA: hypothetical protein VF367_06015 [Candidatus Limnocylindria bacterium]
MSWRRRVAQFAAHVRARVDPAEEADALAQLPPTAAALFEGMPVADRRHAIDVVGALARQGIEDPDVRVAGLLHDVAKGHRVRIWHRVGGVLLEALAPRLLHRIASPDPRSWRHPWFLYLHHARLSAQLAEAAGCSPRAVAFLRGNVPDEDAQLLRALVAADDAS